MHADEHERLEQWVREALARGASTVLLVPDEPPAFRVDGHVVRGEDEPLDAEAITRLAASCFGEERLAALGRTSGALETRLQLGGGDACLVAAARSGGQPTLALLPVRSVLIDVDRLQIPAPIVAATEAKSGLVVVTGPSGCGKTTTCYGLLESLNAKRDLHIVTVGYHLEYVLEPKRALVQNRQVGVDAPDVLGAIASALLQDPDVLFVGEIRELAVLTACLAAAETGHLVLTQLHQPTPAAAIRRMIELQPEDVRDAVRRSLARHLGGVLAQRLLPRASGRGVVPAYGWIVPDASIREAIAPGGDLDRLDAVTPPAGEDLDAHVARLVREGVARRAREEDSRSA